MALMNLEETNMQKNVQYNHYFTIKFLFFAMIRI